MEEIKCWNFLVSCNERVEDGSVINPDFLINSDEFDLIGGSAGGSPTQEGQAMYCLVHSNSFGYLTLVFRVRECNKNVVKDNQEDNQGDGIITSENRLMAKHRRVLLILGFIYKGI